MDLAPCCYKWVGGWMDLQAGLGIEYFTMLIMKEKTKKTVSLLGQV